MIPFTSCWIILHPEKQHIMSPFSVHVVFPITLCEAHANCTTTNDFPITSSVPQQPPTHTQLKLSHPSNVGTPSWRVPCRRGTCRPRGCRALYRCRDTISRSLLFSDSRLSSEGSRVRRSKLSSKIPRVNGPYPEGNVNRCW